MQIDGALIKAFLAVESGGKGFDSATGKIIIQFEPAWFKRKAPFAPTGKWSLNGVERQAAEWAAFNDAFKNNPTVAMESTSIGLPQIMGFHFRRLGYASVGAMWDDFKLSEERQVAGLIKFIESDPRLHDALLAKDWHMVASLYNGKGYKELAKKLGREPYDISLARAYESFGGA